MKKNNKTEHIVTTIMYIIIISVILLIFYIIFSSSKSLINNKSENEEKISTEQNSNEYTNSSNISNNTNNTDTTRNDNDDSINITKNELEEKNQNTKPTTEVQIATYTTTLYDKEQTRIENINLAISKLNGIIIQNNTEFSFNNTLGPMDENSGFKKATGFDSNGKKIKISGGGICQISSTLYNSALIAGFEITERHPHSRRVYYVPKDKDATILYGSLDLKFINNSGAKIRIDASATESTVTISLVKIS
jgi:vancomycin resistance protein YoaR